MFSKIKQSSFLSAVLLCGTFQIAHAQTITKVALTPNGDSSPASDLSVTVDGQQKKVTATAFKAWIVEGGRAALWSSPDGAGGFENEGQALWHYDAKTGLKRKLAAEYSEIDNVRETKSLSGKAALVVSMSDGGLGGPHLAVVDPKRGLVWRHDLARLTAIRNGRLAVGLVTVAAVEAANNQPPKVSRMIYLDVDGLLKRKVIILPRVP